MKEKDLIIKYTIVPKNDNDNYDTNFRLSLTEFAKSLDGKVLIAPLIIYNTDLDIPLDMDESLEEYIIYTDIDNLLNVIAKEETTNVFKTLVLHGFDISLDEVRDIYCKISRRNEANLCINTIQDIELDNNLTFYLYNDLDECDEEEWEETKEQLKQDMQDYIDEYKNFEEIEPDDLLSLLPLFLGDSDEDELEAKEFLNGLSKQIEEKKKDTKDKVIPPVNKSKTNQIINLNEYLDEEDNYEDYEPQEQIITCSYSQFDGYIALNKIGDDLYTIEDDDYEVLLNTDQLTFLIESFNRIKDKTLK